MYFFSIYNTEYNKLINKTSKKDYKDVKSIWITLNDSMMNRIIDEGWGRILIDVDGSKIEEEVNKVIEEAKRDGYTIDDLVVKRCEDKEGKVYEKKTIKEIKEIISK